MFRCLLGSTVGLSGKVGVAFFNRPTLQDLNQEELLYTMLPFALRLVFFLYCLRLSSLLYVDVIEATTIKAGPFIALLLSPRVIKAVELENYQCFSPSIPSGGILESIGLPKGCSSALPLSKGGGTLILPLSAIAMSFRWKTPLLASALLLPQTDLGGDLYSNRRRELIDAMTALPCLKAAVFSGRVEGLSFYDSFRISDPYDMISGDPSPYSIKARASPLLDFTSN
ncbi:hypothetical protein Lal_00002395 [Lupinus albus]|nr:hypothetical protein Lal_00002395 [Lupinus albus]